MLRPLLGLAGRRLCYAVVALWALGSSAALALEPVAVISLSSAEELLGDIQYVTQAEGSPDVGQMVTMMATPYTQGVDVKRPVGIAVGLSPELQPQVVAFVPVTNFQTTLNLLQQQFGPPQDLGNGVLQIQGPAPVFLKEKNGWALVSQTPDQLQDVPADPTQFLGNLHQEYDIAAKILLENVPQQARDMLLAQIDAGMQVGLQREEGESDEAFRSRQQLAEMQVAQLKELMNDLSQFLIGINIDPEQKQIIADFAITGAPGGKIAQQAETLRNARTDYAGFFTSDAAIGMVGAGTIPADQIEQMVTMLGTVRDTALEQIENDADLPDEAAREVAKKVLNDLMGVMIETVRTGKMDAAASVVLEPGAARALMGIYVANGAAVEQTLRDLVTLAQKEPNFPGVQFNADQLGDVRFHTMSIPVPEHEEDARKLLGNQLDLVVGIADKSVYVGVGSQPLASLKAAIQQSQSPTTELESVSQFRISVQKILEFAGSIDKSPQVQGALQAVKATEGDDLILLQALPVENGMKYHIRVEAGVIQAIGGAVRASNQ